MDWFQKTKEIVQTVAWPVAIYLIARLVRERNAIPGPLQIPNDPLVRGVANLPGHGPGILANWLHRLHIAKRVLEPVFYAAGISAVAVAVVAWQQFQTHKRELLDERAVKLLADDPLNSTVGNSFISQYCLGAATVLVNDGKVVEAHRRTVKIGRIKEQDGIWPILEIGNELTLRSLDEKGYVSMCLSDMDKNDTNYFYTDGKNITGLTMRGTAELARRINTEQTYDERAALLVNEVLVNQEVIRAHFYDRICIFEAQFFRALEHASKTDKSGDVLRVWEDVETSNDQIIKYIKEPRNCQKPERQTFGDLP